MVKSVTAYEVRKLDKNTTLTVEVRYSPEFKLRVWVAAKLFMLAGLILGCSVEFENLNDE
ncbi:MAG: hypothetical protein JEZ06_00385 [Anaerolineaceae bacterium]|nr:hypothetical protein [Anaerolineaceae bacterium]